MECFFYPGDVSVGIKCDANVISNKEEDIDFDIIPNANDTITVKYTPPGAGRFTIKVLFAGQVGLSSHNTRMSGMEPRPKQKSYTTFNVDVNALLGLHLKRFILQMLCDMERQEARDSITYRRCHSVLSEGSPAQSFPGES